ncbi:hypothetical protein EPJ66_01565 [Brachyspira aalborgi]|uniref:Pentapeptide repeat-containing protein n=1 Tax=Brachyspira aalborgi TaxID=29522 RepID=A0A5C8FWG4_9SPIR|nr:pentapeptide repeat-containing protein [Brachyspira aalborgi]TXJ38973.1 hypothetical protein EPJ81_07575 [Brachyspira aalborgi]TXJ54022.1 hypothetical protein EPJ66_01565 [Brachyspira aalborgi]
MKQPKIYNTEEDLIKWLKYDLNKQRKKIAKNKSIKKYLVKNEELTLNIGDKNRVGFNFFTIENFDRIDNYRIKVNFEFDIRKIINKLIRTNNNDCPFYINANNIEFNEITNIASKYNQNVDYSYSIFNKEVYSIMLNFDNYVNFDNSIFKSYTNFSSCYFYNGANFSQVSFQYVDFRESNFEKNANFSGSNFINGCSFLLSYFNKRVCLSLAKFYDYCDFRAINSNNIIDFTNSEFYGCFDLTDCNCKGINLNYSEISGKLYIGERITSKYTKFIFISMEDIILKDIDSTILIENCYFKYMKLKNIFNNGIIYLKNIKSANIDLYGTVILGHIFVINCEFKNLKNWQTARIFKHEEYKKSNSIKALEYHAEETKLYKKKLLNKPNKTLKDFGDIFSIYLSSLYSDNGLNWIKSIFMTILITFIFFNIFYIPDLSQTNIRPCYYKYYFSSLIKYFIPTDYEQIKCYVDTSVRVNILIKIFGVIIYFADKIMFWYGSVQTVQAFRKFSKKE